MARMTFKAGNDYALKLAKLAQGADNIAKKALYAAAQPMTDTIRLKLQFLPRDTFRYLYPSEKFTGVPETQRKDLLDSLGHTPPAMDKNSDWNIKVGFDGYGTMPTKKYPKGLPNQMIARSIESGSSVRLKTPFVRPAINATKKESIRIMGKVIDDETKNIMK